MNRFKTLITKLRDEFKISYKIYDLNHKYNLPLTVRLDSTISGIKLSSWGTSPDQDLAFFKASMELVERISIHKGELGGFKKDNFLSLSTIREDEIPTFFNCAKELIVIAPHRTGPLVST